MPERLVGLQEAAERLGVHYNTALRWCRTGRIRAIKLDRVWRITESELDRIAKEGLLPDSEDNGGEPVAAAHP